MNVQLTFSRYLASLKSACKHSVNTEDLLMISPNLWKLENILQHFCDVYFKNVKSDVNIYFGILDCGQ